jgi:hypothetical protein
MPDALAGSSSFNDSSGAYRLAVTYLIACLVTCPLLQYCWEGVFVPGGSPHQVRNLRSSIKVGLEVAGLFLGGNKTRGLA